MSAPSIPRMIAIGLAIGGIFWGGLLLLVFGPMALLPLPFGVGYAVTAGYIVRAVSFPSHDTRLLIWWASILVQGVWLCIDLADFRWDGKHFVTLWWANAVVCSVVALLAERSTATTTVKASAAA